MHSYRPTRPVAAADLKAGSTAFIQTTDGERVAGRVTSVTEAGVTVAGRGRKPARTVALADIAAIQDDAQWPHA